MPDEREALRFVERDTWLGIATHGLCDDAKGRIREEIDTHYNESVRRDIEKGLTPEEVHRAAMDALGDPRKAAQAFGGSQLTKWESEFLGSVADPKLRTGRFGTVFCAVWAGFCFAMSLYFVLWRVGGPWSDGMSCLCGLMGVLMLTELIRDKLAPHLLSLGRKGRAVLWFALTMLADLVILVGAVIWWLSWQSDLPSVLGVLASVVGVLAFGFYLFRLWLKLGRSMWKPA